MFHVLSVLMGRSLPPLCAWTGGQASRMGRFPRVSDIGMTSGHWLIFDISGQLIFGLESFQELALEFIYFCPNVSTSAPLSVRIRGWFVSTQFRVIQDQQMGVNGPYPQLKRWATLALALL